MQLHWTQDFSVGVEEIDTQHKELFETINNLDSAMRKGKAKDETNGLIAFLDKYIFFHFGTEEKYMTELGYQRYSQHKIQHIWFIDVFSDIKKKFGTEGPTADVIVRSNNLLIKWFSNHVRTADMTLGVFLKSKIKG